MTENEKLYYMFLEEDLGGEIAVRIHKATCII